MAADMHVIWLPDFELVHVQFFEAVEHITDEEFDLLEKMKNAIASRCGCVHEHAR